MMEEENIGEEDGEERRIGRGRKEEEEKMGKVREQKEEYSIR